MSNKNILQMMHRFWWGFADLAHWKLRNRGISDAEEASCSAAVWLLRMLCVPVRSAGDTGTQLTSV